MAIFVGTNRVAGMYLGTQRVTAAFLGTELVYSGDGLWTLYDNGAVPGCEWAFARGNSSSPSPLPLSGADLILPRPCSDNGYSSRYICSYAASDEGTYMRLRASGANENRYYSSSIVTTQKMIVPAGVQKLNVDVTFVCSPYKSSGAYAGVGLYPDGTGPISTDSVVSYPTDGFAVWSKYTQSDHTLSMSVFDSMWGLPMYVAISCCGLGDANKDLRVKKVYYT